MPTMNLVIIYLTQNFNIDYYIMSITLTQELTKLLTKEAIDRLSKQNIFDEDIDNINSENEPIPDKPEETPEEKQEIGDLISEDSKLNEITRQVSKTRVPLNNEFQLPAARDSTSFVDLVRRANALADFQRNLFNTKF